MFDKKTIEDIDVTGKRVLVRVDFNVPIRDGKVGDDTRIQAALPTLNYLLNHQATLILCSHLGRPKGEVKGEFSLKPVADHLSMLLGQPVKFVEDCIGPVAEQAVKESSPGDVLLLENTRFHAGEKKNDPAMAKQLAGLADLYVNDAFGSAHRAHASTEGVAQYLPSVAGYLMEKEIIYLGQAIANPAKPFIVILGGAKISDKIGAQGYPVGDSLVEDVSLDIARELIKVADYRLRLPVDVVIGDKFEADAERVVMSMGPIPDGWRILDIGPETVKTFGKPISEAGTIVWNGPMGVFEFPRFAEGTIELAKAIARSNATSIIGGGDSVAAVKNAGLADKITHISTGGGASLEMLEGKVLPGMAALEDRD